jgi:hypothetical protein
MDEWVQSDSMLFRQHVMEFEVSISMKVLFGVLTWTMGFKKD